MGTVTKGFDARLANRPFLVFDFRALWRSTLNPFVSIRLLPHLAANPAPLIQLYFNDYGAL